MRSVAVPLVLFGAACAPSHQMLHQSSAYFELCHSADFDPSVPPSERRACWSAWVEHYRRGQPTERVAFAEERIAQIDRGEDRTQTLGQAPAVTASLIRPANAGAEDSAPNSTQRDASLTLRPTTQTGIDALCAPPFEACMARCEGRGRACQDACRLERRTCLRACY